ncbi:response regulator [Longitalea luteola]|uniref:response regulator n=1 Tax=Longitalea luteola TaxID=2812563 RepID=UPI001A97D019|nr:response regulator [Longitalea luteola]
MKPIFLLADDDIDDRELFCEALGTVDPSITCYCADNGRVALHMLDSKQPSEYPHLIFLDINMPVMNGWECLVQLKRSEAYRHIPVFIYTTSSHQREANIAFDLGADCFFTKPAEYNELKSILKIIANNIGGDWVSAISHFDNIKSR